MNMKNSSAFKRYASEAKSRMLRGTGFPSFVGKVPFQKYDVLMKMVGDNELLCKMCYLIENGGDIVNPMGYLLDKEKFAAMSPENQQRTVFRLAEALACVRKLYYEMNEEMRESV